MSFFSSSAPPQVAPASQSNDSSQIASFSSHKTAQDTASALSSNLASLVSTNEHFNGEEFLTNALLDDLVDDEDARQEDNNNILADPFEDPNANTNNSSNRTHSTNAENPEDNSSLVASGSNDGDANKASNALDLFAQAMVIYKPTDNAVQLRPLREGAARHDEPKFVDITHLLTLPQDEACKILKVPASTSFLIFFYCLYL